MDAETLQATMPDLHRAKVSEKELDTNELSKLKEIEWLKQRRGKFTASEFHRLMGYEDKDELPKGAQTYALEKAVDMLTTESDSYSNPTMDRGNELEIEAVEYFQQITGLKVEKYGDDQEFVQLGMNVGATPDGIISPDGGYEGKAPNSKTHFFYIAHVRNAEDLKKHCKNYYWQVQGSMYVTDSKWWYWCSFDPRFRESAHQMHILKIERNDEDIEKLKKRLGMAIKYRNEQKKLLNFK